MTDEGDGDFSVPSVTLSYEAATALLDELWAAGLRPSGELSSQGERDALRNHIKALESEVGFLRQLVTHQLGIPV